MGRKFSAVKIDKFFYSDLITVYPTKANIVSLIQAGTEVKNMHQDSYSYEEADPSLTKYKNQLTGVAYRVEVEGGDKTIKFTIGEYDFETKAALQGGTAASDGSAWEAGDPTEVRYKSVFAITKDNICIVFPKAVIVGNGKDADKAVGIGLNAMPLEGDFKDELWIDVQGLNLSALVLDVSPTSLAFTAAADATGKTITANSTASVSYASAPSNSEWLTVTKSGKVVTVKVSANANSESRMANVTVIADGKTAIVPVTQAGA